MRPALKIACLICVSVVLAAAVVFWERHQERLERLPRSVGTPISLSARTPLRPSQSMMIASSPTRNVGRVLVPVTHPSPTLPNNAIRFQDASPADLDRVRLIVNADGTAGFPERINAVRAFKARFTDQEVEAFSRYLHMPAQGSLDPVDENWLRNEMLDKLVQQADLPRGLPDLLVSIYQDLAQDEVMRDYAVQHMAPAYDRASTQEKTALQNALWQATMETDTSIGGTALLGLLDIAHVDSTISQSRLADTALKLAADDRCGELARITAVQVCGRLGVEQALPIVEQLSLEGPSMPLRMAATAALGDIGNSAATNLLSRLSVSADPRQALAAETALRRIARTQAALAKQTGRGQ